MKTFNKNLKSALKNKNFKKAYDYESELARIAVDIQMAREAHGLSQSALAKKAHITQQQLSKIENGFNCNLSTLLKVCQVLKLNFKLISA